MGYSDTSFAFGDIYRDFGVSIAYSRLEAWVYETRLGSRRRVPLADCVSQLKNWYKLEEKNSKMCLPIWARAITL